MVLKVLKKIIKQNYLLFHEGIDYFKNNKNWKCKTPFEVNSEIVRDMYSSYSPVFVLSTGRCGTKFLSELLNNFNNIKAYHEAKPHMELFCNDIFYYNKKNYNDLIFIFNSIRYILILDSYIKNKIYFESNHALTFFAYAIKNCFNNAKFIHIIRDPRTFVRSAFIRDWYTDSSIWDVGRLMMENKKIWNKLDRIEKISWLWYTTNQYIENFKESNKGHVLIHTIKFEELFNDSNKLLNLVKFIGVNNVSTDFIKKFMKKKINSSKKENIKKSNYKVWNNVSNKEKINNFTNKLAKKYNY